MANDPAKAKWTPIDSATAKNLIDQSAAPGQVFPLEASAVPEQLRNLPGAVSYFASSYSAPIALTPSISAGGEYAVVRHDGDTAKAYNYIFATSTDQKLYFSGPHKDFPAHHFTTSTSVSAETLFGQPFVVTWKREP